HLSISAVYLRAPTVEISAPNLLTIRYEGVSPKDFVLNGFPSLVEAEAFFRYQGKGFVKLFENVSNANLLKINADSFL
ncbi:hypothetical protein MKW92_008214, partial [Papaver armeniacum]